MAEDITSAMMFATEHLDTFREELAQAGVKKLGDLRITHLHEEYAVVAGRIAHNHEDFEWVQKLANNVKEKNLD